MLLENLSLGLAVGFLSLIIASIWDIKIREVPDWISFSLMFFATGYSLILTVHHANIWFFVNALAGMALGLGIGLLMFYTGQWGGGDSKLMIGICGILGFAIPDVSKLHANQEILVFIVNLLLAGAIYGLLFSLGQALLNFKNFKIAATKELENKKNKLFRLVLFCILLLAVIFFTVSRSIESTVLLMGSVGSILLFYMWIMIKSVETTCMIKNTLVKDLTEGDWLVEPVSKANKTIVTPSKTGLTLEEIKTLKENGIKSVTVKNGMPFVPSFLIAYSATLIFGNWLAYLL